MNNIYRSSKNRFHIYRYTLMKSACYSPRNYQRDDRKVLRWKSFPTQEVSTGQIFRQSDLFFVTVSPATKRILGAHCLPRIRSSLQCPGERHRSPSNRCHSLYFSPRQTNKNNFSPLTASPSAASSVDNLTAIHIVSTRYREKCAAFRNLF